MITQAVFFQGRQDKPFKDHHHPSSSIASSSSADFQPPKSRMKEGHNPLHDQMAIHLQMGFNLMQAGQFEEATKHFQDAQRLKAMGIKVVSAKRSAWNFNTDSSFPSTLQEVKERIQTAATQNMAFDKEGQLSIKFANIGLMLDPETRQNIEKNYPQQAVVLKHLAHENALMAAEENIHTYQNMRKQNLSYNPVLGQEGNDDDEIDIAATLAKYGVPVTKDFMARYRGREKYVSHPEVWDLVETDEGKMTRVQLPPKTSRVDKRKAIIPPGWNVIA